ncbi:HAD family hydrolase [Halobellus marinus]|uniref:HAD family hydrolase n=1 Tax=Halobellus TaxID=1073986 RepID=UPI0028AD8084|nr:HAD family hydrolase [Halobellus sp. DFY28]
MSAFDAVLFDLDGTLCRRTQDTAAVYAAAFEHVGATPFGEPADLWAALDGPPDHDDWTGYIGAGFARLAAQNSRTDVDPLALAAALREFVDDSAVAFTEGANAALDSAAGCGGVGVVTNGPKERQEPKLCALGVLDRLDSVVYAADLHRKKPHALPFHRALAELETSSERALYVGNSLAYDVSGAQNAGLPVAWLRSEGSAAAPYEPEYVIDSLSELPAILEGER